MTGYGYKILHVTPHFGGGVGSVLLEYLAREKKNVHSAVSLDVANAKAIAALDAAGVPLRDRIHERPTELCDRIAAADLVLFHFWNHPLAYDLLVNQTFPPSRIVFWGHVSGLHPPYVFPVKLFDYADRFVFTTPISLSADEVKGYARPGKLSVVPSTSGVERFAAVVRKPHPGFNIGYIGTVDYAKLHPDFPRICADIAKAIPEARFLVASNDSQDRLRHDVRQQGIADKFDFMGVVADAARSFALFDLLGYPLNPRHFGTAEQVLQEAMAAGVLPVVLANPAESGVVRDFGVVAEDPDAYVAAVIALHREPKRRAAMAAKAREFAGRQYAFAALLEQWQDIFDAVMAGQKRERAWADDRRREPYELFLESVGIHRALFTAKEPLRSKNLAQLARDPAWMSSSKGSPFQYAYFFPDDLRLRSLCGELRVLSSQSSE